MIYMQITNIHGREILDSRGNPTVEAEVTLTETSTGKGLRDVLQYHPVPVPDGLRQ